MAAPAFNDPLLDELQRLRQSRNAIDHAIRVLIAYGREFTQPRPYTLAELAGAAGMSISGVRTAYNDKDINTVADVIGRPSRDCQSQHTQPACPECGERIIQCSPINTPWLQVWTATGHPIPEWSHLDGQPLCPVMGEHGYEPATYRPEHLTQ